jgi:hypothetical protein
MSGVDSSKGPFGFLDGRCGEKAGSKAGFRSSRLTAQGDFAERIPR